MKMQAISQGTLGGPDVLRVVEVDRPEPGPTEVLVRVHAAGLNPTDCGHRAHGGFLGRPPFVLGWDVSGVVEAVGLGATVHRVGDAVFGMLRYPYGGGAHAEYVTAPSRTFAHKPANLDHVHAGALPLAALTAWQALVDVGRVRPGQRVLVHAAAGGVGHLAVQLAKAHGAHVIGTARGAKHAFVHGLGADEMIDYTRVDFAEAAHDIDIVLDTVGGDYGPRSLRTLRAGGVLVSIEASEIGDVPAELGVRVVDLVVEPDHAALTRIAELAESGRLRVEVAAVVPFTDAAKAHALGDTRRATGKIVLTMV